MSSEDFFKTTSRRPGQDQYIRLGHTSSRRLETPSRRFQDVLQKRLQDVFKPIFIPVKYMRWSFFAKKVKCLTLSRRRPLSYRNQSIHLLCKSIQNQSSKGFLKKGVIRNFIEFTKKYLCRNLFF